MDIIKYLESGTSLQSWSLNN